MGTDIHMVAEIYCPTTQRWLLVGQREPTREELHAYLDMDIGSPEWEAFYYYRPLPEDHPYPLLAARLPVERNYLLFAALAGVCQPHPQRGHPLEPIAPPRGIPGDCSPALVEMDSNENEASWVLLSEVFNHCWYQPVMAWVNCSHSWIRYWEKFGRHPEGKKARRQRRKALDAKTGTTHWYPVPLYPLIRDFFDRPLVLIRDLAPPEHIRLVFWFY